MAATNKYTLAVADDWVPIGDLTETNLLQLRSGGPVTIRFDDAEPDAEADLDGFVISIEGLRELSVSSSASGGGIYARVYGTATAEIVVLSVLDKTVSPAPDPEPTGLFFDDFNRPDEDLEASENWTLVSGTPGSLTIIDGELHSLDSSGPGTLYYPPDPLSTDHFVEYTVAQNARESGPFLIVRATDANNFFGFRLHDASIEVYRRLDGGLGFVNWLGPDQGVIIELGDTLRMEADGPDYRIYHNGSMIDEGQIDTDLPVGGRVGLISRATVTEPWLTDFKSGPLT